MPNGFPAFRFDPTTAPRYLVKTAKPSPDTASTYAASSYTDSSQQSDDTAKMLKHQYPAERDSPKESHSKPKRMLKKLLG